MISPIYPSNEKLRQKAVDKYELVDTLSEDSYDDITSLISYICETPISLITLLDHDRNFLKSHHGITFNESPREISFCGHTILSDSPIMTVEDAREDKRFHDNPLVLAKKAIFYAGVPLINPEGYKLGTLCVYDTKPRVLSPEQETALKTMAKQVVILFEERLKNKRLIKLQAKLEARNENLEKFAAVVSHDLKSPLAQITSLTQLIEESIGDALTEETQQYFDYIKLSSESMRAYIDGILKFNKADGIDQNEKELINVEIFVKSIVDMFRGDQMASINLHTKMQQFEINKAAVTQILVNLVGNALKYNDNALPIVNITIAETAAYYTFQVADNGPGIPKEHHSKIFELFVTAHKEDNHGNQGTGIGLATVKKVVNTLGGKISVSSEKNAGAIFEFTIAKR